MKQCFTKRCGLALVLMLFAFVQGTWAQGTKKDPYIELTTPAEAILGQQSYAPPTVTILTEKNGERIRKYFKVTYKIDGVNDYLKNSAGSDSLDGYNHKYYQDPKTGTTINEFSGAVKIGDKATGDVKVIVTATPSQLYDDQYNTGTSDYTIHIKAPDKSTFNLAVPYKGSNLKESDALRIITSENPYNSSQSISNSVTIDPINVRYSVNGRNVDCTSEFTITASASDKDLVITPETKNGKTSYKITSKATTTKDNMTITFTAVPKDDAAKAKYGSDLSVTFTAKVNSTRYAKGQKIKTYIVFDQPEQKKYKYVEEHLDDKYYKGLEGGNNAFKPQHPRVVDEFGNDVTDYYTINYWIMADNAKPQDVFYNFSDNPFDKGKNMEKAGSIRGMYSHADLTEKADPNGHYINMYGPDNGTVGRPDDYIITGSATKNSSEFSSLLADTADYKSADGSTKQYHGQFYDYNHDNVYNIYPGQYILHVVKRAPEIVFNPDPSTVDVAHNYRMYADNRFKITGKHTDEIIGYTKNIPPHAEGGNFTYAYFVPDAVNFNKQIASHTDSATLDKYCIDNNTVMVEAKFPSDHEVENVETTQPVYDADGNQATNEDGTFKYEKMRGTIYIAMLGDGRDNEWSLTFHGLGKVPLYYYFIPYDGYSWNISASQAKVYSIVHQEPVKIIVDPRSYTIRKGETAGPPSVKVVDQFGKDLTKYYKYTWNYTAPTEGAHITFDANSHVASGTAIGGPDQITIRAEKQNISDVGETEYNKWLTDEGWTPTVYADKPDNQETDGNYTIDVITEQVNWEVIYDDSYYRKNGSELVNDNSINEDDKDAQLPEPYRKHAWTSKMGKLHFINNNDDYATVAANFDPGQYEDCQTPGMYAVFGTGLDRDSWKVEQSKIVTESYDGDTFDKHGTIVVKATPALFGSGPDDEDPLPYPTKDKKLLVSGGCVQFRPITNGYLQIDGNYGTASNPVTYTLVDITDNNLFSDNLTRPNSVGSDPASDGEYNSTSADIDKPKLKETSSGIMYGDQRFRYALLAGHTYYLYSDDETFVLHGFTFMPAYVVMREDNNSAHRATVFADNGFTGDLPMIVNNKQSTVTFTRTWADNNWNKVYTPENSTTSRNAGDAVKVLGGYQIVGKDYTLDKRVRVRASVKGIKHADGKQVERAPYIDVAVVGIPIYKVGADFLGTDPGDTVSTTNFVTRIRMTWGGWKPTDKVTYPYYDKNDFNGKQLSDSWRGATEVDSVGMNNQTIDGFKFFSGATQNPVDENGHAWKYRLQYGETSNTFNLPVRGGYVKFEPEENGTLMVYVLQNGLTDMVQNDNRKLENQPWQLRRRAMYIVDEGGHAVPILDDSKTWTSNSSIAGAFSESETNSSKHKDYMTEGVLRFTYDNSQKKTGNVFDFSRWWTNYKGGRKSQDFIDDSTAVRTQWEALSLGQTQELVKLKDSSYVVPTKAYVRYTFQVKAGKTYYVWASGSKLNFCGFAFVPARFLERSESTEWPAIDQETQKANKMSIEEARAKLPEPSDDKYSQSGKNIDDNGAGYYNQVISEGSKEAPTNYVTIDKNGQKSTDKFSDAKINFVNVTLNRTFKNNEWTSICLPFSVNETQVKKLFGNDAMIITFDSVMTKHKVHTDYYQEEEPADVEARTAHFTCHVNQLIEAGRPYFIKPAFSDNKDHTSIEFKHVSLEAVKPMNILCKNDSAIKDSLFADTMLSKHSDDLTKEQKTALTKQRKDKAIFTYSFKGIYDYDQIPWYSYVMGTQTVDGQVRNGLWRIVPSETTSTVNISDKTTWPHLKGFRAYLYPSKDEKGEDIKLEESTSAAKYWITGAEVYGDAGNGTATGIEQLVEEMNTMMTAGRKGVYNLKGQMVRMENNINGLPAGVYIMNGKKYLVK